MNFSFDSYVQKQRELISYERAEVALQERKVLSTPLLELERTGVGIIDLVASSIRVDKSGRQVCTLHAWDKRRLFTRHFKAGDKVKLMEMVHEGKSTPQQIRRDAFSAGMILDVNPMQLVVHVFANTEVDEVGLEETHQKLEQHSVQYALLKLSDEYTYDIWDATLTQLQNTSVTSPMNNVLGCLLFGKEHIHQSILKLLVDTDHLNLTQEKAVFQSLSSPLSLIHGPPGTGKSTALACIIENIILNKKRVLVCAASNTAVDQLMEKVLSSREIKDIQSTSIRVGKVEKVSKALEEICLHTKINNQQDLTIQSAVSKLNQQEDHQYACRHDVSLGDVEEVLEQVKKQRQLVKAVEKEQKTDIQNKAMFVGCTLTLAQTLECDQFEYVIIDEAAQAVEMACMAAILKGRNLVLAGDHQQLPPTILSRKAELLAITTFERCVLSMHITKNNSKHTPCVHKSVRDRVVMLDTQHRMNQDIMDWSSKNQYEGKLKAADAVARQLLSHEYKYPQYPILSTPWMLLNTNGVYLEGSQEQSKSNRGEGELLVHWLVFFISLGVPATRIGVISPYKAQVLLIQDQIFRSKYDWADQIDVKTVDAYQGNEKDIILISCVRSNKDGDVGFLKDKRRMNVAVTRAKKFVGIIADASTLQKDKFLSTLTTHRPQFVYNLETMRIDDNKGITFTKK